MRLFLAITLPEKRRQEIHLAGEPLRDAGLPVRWIEPASYHLTLKFLGEVRPEAMAGVERVVSRVASATRRFPLVLGGFGAFPTIRRPQVLWLGAEPSPALRCLKQDLEWALTEQGFERETRAFHPHVTLGRVEGDDGAGAFRGLDELAAGLEYRSSLEVSGVDLMRSHLSRQGTRYSVFQSFPLAPPSPA